MYSVLLLTMLSTAEPGGVQPQQAVMQANGCNGARMQTYLVPRTRGAGCSGSTYAISQTNYLRASGCSGGQAVAASYGAGCSGGAARSGPLVRHQNRVAARHDARAVRRSGRHAGATVEAVAVEAVPQCTLAVTPAPTVVQPPPVIVQPPPVAVPPAPPQATIQAVPAVPIQARVVVPRQRIPVVVGYASCCPTGTCPNAARHPIFGWR